MADKVISANEIILNSRRFPIDGFVKESLINRFPPKMIVGESEYSNEQILSNWLVNDQRGGLLVEEMDESVHQDRYWWSTCDTRFRSNVLLPPLATQATAPSSGVTSIAIANKDFEENSTSWTTGARSSTQAHADTYSWLYNNQSGYQILTWDDALQGRGIVFKCWVYTAAGSTGRIGINDGVGTTYSSYHTGAAGWEQLTATRTLDGSATRLWLYLLSDTANATYFDDATATESACTIGAATHFANFNGILYVSWGSVLASLSANGTSFDVVADFTVTITDLFSDGTQLFVLLGDIQTSIFNFYCWIDTSGGIWRSYSVAAAYKEFGIYWDSRVMMSDSAGVLSEMTTPAAVAVVGVGKGTIPVADGDLQAYDIYRDSNGDDIIYARTKVGLYAHDYANTKWYLTELGFPGHATAGIGGVVWHDAYFISTGTAVHKYVVATTATITQMGLDKDDGLPQLRGGEIVELIKGYNELFALIDSTYEGSGSRSQVMSYDGKGWRTWWEATADNKAMYSGIVSSDTDLRLWFSTTDGVYSIPLQTTTFNPKKVSGYTYAAAGVHITPRFDAGTKTFTKLATKLTLFLNDMSANETVIVTYQIDQAQGALTSGWTALGSTQTGDGAKELTFGTNGVGIEFKDIQFRIALARGGTNTNSPIIKGMALSFLKLLDRKKSWSFRINTAEAGRVGATPKELVDAIGTIVSTSTLMPFTFRDGSNSADTFYVMIHPFYGVTPTGQSWDAIYEISCVAV